MPPRHRRGARPLHRAFRLLLVGSAPVWRQPARRSDQGRQRGAPRPRTPPRALALCLEDGEHALDERRRRVGVTGGVVGPLGDVQCLGRRRRRAPSSVRGREGGREGGRGDVTHTQTQTQTQNTTRHIYTHTHACARARAHTQTPMHAHARGEKRPRRPADHRTGFALRVDHQTDPRALQMPLS